MTTTYETGHQHSTRCWWDHRQARWVCPPALRQGVDVRDMLVVHTALLRELRLAPAAVARAAGDRRRVERADRHLRLVRDLLHHHHTGEDELLWPVLRPRLGAAQQVLLDLAEDQHAAIDAALREVEATRCAWYAEPAAAAGLSAGLTAALARLHELLVEHLETEERDLLPLAAAYLEPAEWQALADTGAASVPKRLTLLVFGMFAYEGDPQVLRLMLAPAPPPVRALVPRLAPRVYRRYAARVHGTRRP